MLEPIHDITKPALRENIKPRHGLPAVAKHTVLRVSGDPHQLVLGYRVPDAVDLDLPTAGEHVVDLGLLVAVQRQAAVGRARRHAGAEGVGYGAGGGDEGVPCCVAAGLFGEGFWGVCCGRFEIYYEG